MSYRHPFDPRHHYYRGGVRRWRRRRRSRTSAGAVLVGLLVIMAVMGLGRAPQNSASPPQGVGETSTSAAPQVNTAPTKDAIAASGESHGEQGLETGRRNSPDAAQVAEVSVVPVAEAEDEPTDSEDLVEPTQRPDTCVDAACRRAFAGFVASPSAKAFVTSGNGRGYWDADPVSLSEAIRRALERCNREAGAACTVVRIVGPGS